MNNTKTTKKIIVIVMAVFMMLTMFLPAFKYNGDNVIDAFGEYLSIMKTTGTPPTITKILSSDATITEYIDLKNDDIAAFEKQTGINYSNVTAFNIMTQSFEKRVYGNKASGDDVKKFQNDANGTYNSLVKQYNNLRMILIFAYVLIFATLVVTILSLIFDLGKLSYAILSLVTGILGTGIFAYMRFGILEAFVKNAPFVNYNPNLDDDFLHLLADKNLNVDLVVNMLKHFYSFGFLAAMILGILLTVASIVFLFMKEPKKAKPVPAPQHVQIDGLTEKLGRLTPPPVPAPVPAPQPAPAPAPKAKLGRVRCVGGVATGKGLSIDGANKVIVGKSSKNANLVISDPHISNVHCSIRYNPATDTYLVKDHSTNGTFVNGSRLVKETAMEYPSNTVIDLADGKNKIMLG